jgi:hypothetical protein
VLAAQITKGAVLDATVAIGGMEKVERVRRGSGLGPQHLRID